MEIQLEVMDKADVSTSSNNPTDTNLSENNAQDPIVSGVDGLMLEVTSKSFGTDTQAFKLNFRGRAAVSVNFRESWEFESTLFIEGFKVEYHRLNCTPPLKCNGDLRVEHWSRMCGICRYKLHARTTLSPGQAFFSCNDSRRTLVKFGGDSPSTVFIYSFTFLNCA